MRETVGGELVTFVTQISTNDHSGGDNVATFAGGGRSAVKAPSRSCLQQ
jgi:hypothetical protein